MLPFWILDSGISVLDSRLPHVGREPLPRVRRGTAGIRGTDARRTPTRGGCCQHPNRRRGRQRELSSSLKSPALRRLYLRAADPNSWRVRLQGGFVMTAFRAAPPGARELNRMPRGDSRPRGALAGTLKNREMTSAKRQFGTSRGPLHLICSHVPHLRAVLLETGNSTGRGILIPRQDVDCFPAESW